jgi:hypothetical protein
MAAIFGHLDIESGFTLKWQFDNRIRPDICT